LPPPGLVRLIRCALVGAAISALSAPVRGGVNRWTSNGPYGGAVSALAIDPVVPTTLYAGVPYVGLYKTLDGAAHWSLILPTDDWIPTLAVDTAHPSTVYASLQEGLLKSTDGGESWLPLGLPGVGAIAIDPRSPEIVYVESGAGISKSTDGGATWSSLAVLPPVGQGMGLAMDLAHADVLYALGRDVPAGSTRLALYRTDDGGANWTLIATPDAYLYSVTVDPVSSRVYIASDGGVFRSVDRGTTWASVLGGNFFTVRAVRGSEIYAYGLDPGGLFQTVDGGDHWAALSTPLPMQAVVAGSPTEPATLYMGLDGAGVAKSVDQGRTLSILSEGIRGLYPSIAMDPDQPSDVFAGSDAGLSHSLDGGGAWSLVNSSYALTAVAIQPGTLDLFSVLGQSSDGGVTWRSIAYPIESPTVPAIPRSMPRTLFIGNSCPGGTAQVFKSSDSGVSWSRVFDSGQPGCVSLLVSSGGTEVIAMVRILEGEYYEQRVSQSRDGGLSWMDLDTSGWLDGPDAVVLAVDPTDPNVVYAEHSAKLWISNVGGGQWKEISTGLATLTPVSSLVVDPVSPTTLYVSTLEGVFRSADRGVTWSPLSDGLPPGPASALAIDATGRFLHVESDRGVFDYEIVAPCAATSGALCLLGSRFVVTAQAIDPRTGRLQVGTALSQTDQWGYFSLPGFTGDPNFPEIVVKMADARSIGDGFWFFHSGLTDLQYTLSVLDTVTGQQKSYQNDRSDPQALCGGADTGTFTDAASAVAGAGVAFRARAAAPGAFLTLLGRFAARLSAIDPRTGNQADGVPIGRDPKWGYFSLPAFTGDATFPEVFVKMLDGTALDGFFWVFHTGLTDLEYTLTITDSTTGVQRVYHNERSDPSRLCGGADTAAFHD
jgi:photosystem II stability/assembly factor-like uncharacterized protein